MTNDKGILIKNIYYMLSYAFQVLKQQDYEDVAAEEFDEVYKLFAAILCKGVPRLLKQGLHKEYKTHHDNMTSMRGKLDINGTIINKMQQKQLLACEYDELSENNIYNQIIKTTMYCLIRADKVKSEHKTTLKKLDDEQRLTLDLQHLARYHNDCGGAAGGCLCRTLLGGEHALFPEQD